MNIAQTIEKITDLLDGLTSVERDNVCEWLAEKNTVIADIMKQKDEEIADLLSEINELEDIVSEKENDIERLEVERDELEDIVSEKENDIERLEVERDELEWRNKTVKSYSETNRK